MMPSRTWTLALAALAAGCGRLDTASPTLDALDAQLADNAAVADPALAAALHDQIMVDPALAQSANRHALRPPPMPVSAAQPATDIAAAAMPAEHDVVRPAPAAHGTCTQCLAAREALTLGAFAAHQPGAIGACAGSVGYSFGWANRLPAAVPLYPDARVTEAAGADGHGCRLRIVSFASSAPPQHLLDWYYTRTGAAGFAAGHGSDGASDVLAGTRTGGDGRDGAFLLLVRARPGGGSEADLMADAG